MQVSGSRGEWNSVRAEALGAKRVMLLSGTWGAIKAADPDVGQAAGACVYVGGLAGRAEWEVRALLEGRCGRLDDFEWCRSWCFAKFGGAAGAARALGLGSDLEGLVVVPAPAGRVVRGGVLLEMGLRGTVNV